MIDWSHIEIDGWSRRFPARSCSSVTGTYGLPDRCSRSLRLAVFPSRLRSGPPRAHIFQAMKRAPKSAGLVAEAHEHSGISALIAPALPGEAAATCRAVRINGTRHKRDSPRTRALRRHAVIGAHFPTNHAEPCARHRRKGAGRCHLFSRPLPSPVPIESTSLPQSRADRLPHLLRTHRHLDMSHPEMPKGVDDGVAHRGQRGDRAALAAPLAADDVVRRRRLQAA